MRMGPVPSEVLILNGLMTGGLVFRNVGRLAWRRLCVEGRAIRILLQPKRSVLICLCGQDSDVEIIDEVIAKFGNWNFQQNGFFVF